MRKSSRYQVFEHRIEVFAQATVACGMMIWGLVNFWSNVFGIHTPQNTESEPSWWITFVFVILTAVIPTGLGVWWLRRTLFKRDQSQ